MTDLRLGKGRRKPGVEKAALGQPDEAVALPSTAPEISTETAPETEAKTPATVVYDHDDEAGTVDFELSDGTPMQLTSPKSSHFLTVVSWAQTADEEMRSPNMLMLCLAARCTTQFGKASKASFNQLIAKLDETDNPDDMKRIMGGLLFFRDRIEHFFKSAAH